MHKWLLPIACVPSMFIMMDLPIASAQPSVTWVERTSTNTNPGRRMWAPMVYDIGRGRCVLFGGFSGTSVLADTWEWNGSEWVSRPAAGPSARTNHAMAYDTQRGKTVLFGGSAGGSANNAETWEWDGSTWTQRLVSGPSPRNSHSMAYDSQRGVVVLFGGDLFNGTTSSETWEWNGSTWTQRAVGGPAPSPRYYHAMAYDSMREKTVLFGGFGGEIGTENNQTWEWDGTAWTLMVSSTPSPDARRYHAMAFDALRGVCVMHAGGTDTFTESDVWEWNGVAWNRRNVTGPSYRTAHAMAFDTVRGTIVMTCGREQDVIENDTWELGLRCITTHPVPTVACVHNTVALTVASAVEPASFTWRKDRTPIDTTLNPTAAQSVLQLPIASDADGGVYDCIVSSSCGTLASNPVRLTVCTADANCSGAVNADDIFAFLDAWFAQNGQTGAGHSADFNGSGDVTADDIFAFLDAWFLQDGECS